MKTGSLVKWEIAFVANRDENNVHTTYIQLLIKEWLKKCVVGQLYN